MWDGLAVLIVLLPIVTGVVFIFDHTVVTNLVTGFMSSLTASRNVNDVIFTGSVCPNGSPPNPSGSLWWVIIGLLLLVPDAALGLVGFVIYVGSIPCVLFAAFAAGAGLIGRDSGASRAGVLMLLGWLAIVVLFGLALRGIHMLTLAGAGC